MGDFLDRLSQAGAPSGVCGLLRGGRLVAGVEVSVLVSETHTRTASPTSVSLETGALVADHVIVNPAEVSVAFVMTNTGGGAEAARDALATFTFMLQNRQLLTLGTEHCVYENMVLTGVSPQHNAPFKGALTFTLNLQQINFVSLQSVGRSPDILPEGEVGKTASARVRAGLIHALPL